jgi:opacity protein-like surface antigen
MKEATKIFALISLCVVLAPVAARAQYGSLYGWQNRGYFRFDGGGVVTSSTEVTEIFGPVPAGTRVEFDPGPRFGFNFGYNVTDWFAPELEFGWNANNVSSITGAYVDGTFYEVPILVNVKFQLPNRTPFVPYAGIGGGGSGSILYLDHLDYGPLHVYGTESDFQWAWQAFGGLRVNFNHRMALGVEYRYFRSGAPSFGEDHSYYFGSSRISFGEIESHIISLQFDLTF